MATRRALLDRHRQLRGEAGQQGKHGERQVVPGPMPNQRTVPLGTHFPLGPARGGAGQPKSHWDCFPRAKAKGRPVRASVQHEEMETVEVDDQESAAKTPESSTTPDHLARLGFGINLGNDAKLIHTNMEAVQTRSLH